MISLEINWKKYEVDVKPDVPLLWVVREHLKLTGTKYGCGIAICGASPDPKTVIEASEKDSSMA